MQIEIVDDDSIVDSKFSFITRIWKVDDSGVDWNHINFENITFKFEYNYSCHVVHLQDFGIFRLKTEPLGASTKWHRLRRKQ